MSKEKARQQDDSFVERSFHIERLLDESSQEATYKVSLSSETPVRDWPWAPPNILVHDKNSIDLSGITKRGLPLFTNHNARDLSQMVGRIVNVRLEDKRLVGELRFSSANPDAAMVRGMVDEGTLTDMSIRAEPLKIQRIEGSDGKAEVIRWMRWRPMEGSVVGIGADQSVGIGRQLFEQTATAGGAEMEDGKEAAGAEKSVARQASEAAARIELGAGEAEKNFAAENEKARVQAIRNLAQVNNVGEDTAQEWITRGYSLARVADDILAIVKQRGESRPESVSALGLSRTDTSKYSLCRAILASHAGDWRGAGFELECHNAIAERSGRAVEKGHFFVPLEVQRREQAFDGAAFMERHAHQFGYLSRDLNSAIGGQGGFLVNTRIASFDELLRNIAFVYRMGATRLSGLRDNIAIPRQSAAATAEWLTSETDSPAESQQTFVQLSMAPKTVSAYTELSRKLLMQASIDVEGLVNADLAAVAALAADSAAVNGTGASGQPLGILATTGVGSVSGSSLGFAGILETQTDLAAANVMPLRGGYVTTPAVAALMMQEVKFASTAAQLWVGNIWNGVMEGFPAMSTNQMPSATMVFGDWSKLVIGEWGVLEIDTNPYAQFSAGIVGVRAMYSIDVGVRLPAAFTAATSIT